RIRWKPGEGFLVEPEATSPAVQAEAKAAGTQAVMLRVEDAFTHCEKARAAGARILTEPVDHMYGERQYNAEDPFGHRWDFTQTVKDVAPDDWGGEPVELD